MAGLSISVPCAPEVLYIVAAQLKHHGVFIVFNHQLPSKCIGGVGLSESGTFEFCLEENLLIVRVKVNRGHFSDKMLIGGIRQLVEEATELLARDQAQRQSPEQHAARE